jgi:hypothetical protein
VTWEPDSTSGELETVGDAAVVRASLNQPEQFGAVFEQHHNVIWRYLARLAGSERADELAGEVFLVALPSEDPTTRNSAQCVRGCTGLLRTCCTHACVRMGDEDVHLNERPRNSLGLDRGQLDRERLLGLDRSTRRSPEARREWTQAKRFDCSSNACHDQTEAVKLAPGIAGVRVGLTCAALMISAVPTRVLDRARAE